VVGSLRTQSFWNIEKPISNIVFAIDIIFEDFLSGFDLLADLPTACICQTGGDIGRREDEPKLENSLTFVSLKVKSTNWRLVDSSPTLGRIFRPQLRPKIQPVEKIRILIPYQIHFLQTRDWAQY
jgi:hypothetical protein